MRVYNVLLTANHSKDGKELRISKRVKPNNRQVSGLKPDVLLVENEGYFYGVVESMQPVHADFVSNGVVVKVGESYPGSKEIVYEVETEEDRLEYERGYLVPVKLEDPVDGLRYCSLSNSYGDPSIFAGTDQNISKYLGISLEEFYSILEPYSPRILGDTRSFVKMPYMEKLSDLLFELRRLRNSYESSL